MLFVYNVLHLLVLLKASIGVAQQIVISRWKPEISHLLLNFNHISSSAFQMDHAVKVFTPYTDSRLRKIWK
jgi:hypothetical protein